MLPDLNIYKRVSRYVECLSRGSTGGERAPGFPVKSDNPG